MVSRQVARVSRKAAKYAKTPFILKEDLNAKNPEASGKRRKEITLRSSALTLRPLRLK